MGGGTPLIEANRVGCDVEGMRCESDVGLGRPPGRSNTLTLRATSGLPMNLIAALRTEIDRYYRTRLPTLRRRERTRQILSLGQDTRLRSLRRVVRHVSGVPARRRTVGIRRMSWCVLRAATSTKSTTARAPGPCTTCGAALPADWARSPQPMRLPPRCGHTNSYPGEAAATAPTPRFSRSSTTTLRKKPSTEDASSKNPNSRKTSPACGCSVKGDGNRWLHALSPIEHIPAGDETGRLHRWGYSRYREMFNPRQLLGLELSCRLIADTERRAHPPRSRDQSLGPAALPEHVVPLRHDGAQVTRHLLRSRLPRRPGAVRVQSARHRQQLRGLMSGPAAGRTLSTSMSRPSAIAPRPTRFAPPARASFAW